MLLPLNDRPTILTWSGFFSFGFVNVYGCYDIIAQTVRAAVGVHVKQTGQAKSTLGASAFLDPVGSSTRTGGLQG